MLFVRAILRLVTLAKMGTPVYGPVTLPVNFQMRDPFAVQP